MGIACRPPFRLLTPNMPNQTVTIYHRAPTGHDALINKNARYRIGSVFHHQAPLRALTPDEENRILSVIMGIQSTDPRFGQKAREFWAEIKIDVPDEGVTLNYSVDANNFPINPLQYVHWRFVQAHPFVAVNLATMMMDGQKSFYIHDVEHENRALNHGVKNRTKAYMKFAEISEDASRLDLVLRMLGSVNPSLLNMVQKQNAIEEAVKQSPERFLELVSDKHLIYRAFLMDLVAHGLVAKYGQQYVYKDQTMGESETDAINFIKNKRNSEIVLELKSLLRMKRPDAIYESDSPEVNEGDTTSEN